jgi:hypothetical protein
MDRYFRRPDGTYVPDVNGTFVRNPDGSYQAAFDAATVEAYVRNADGTYSRDDRAGTFVRNPDGSYQARNQQAGAKGAKYASLPDVGSQNTHFIAPAAVTAVTNVKTASGFVSELHLIGGEVIKVALEASKIFELFAAL